MKATLSIAPLLGLLLACNSPVHADQSFKTRHASIRIDDKGFVASLVATASGKEYSPAGHASSLMSLHESGRPNSELVTPQSATYDAAKKEFTLTYPNGCAAVVKVEAKDGSAERW